MKLIDLHTHKKDEEGYLFILNCAAEKAEDIKNISIGLHPWDIDEDWPQKIQEISKKATTENVKAIGECGIDKIGSRATTETQTEVLKAHIELSEQLQKPLILHIVKGQEIIMQLHKKSRPTQAWIIHGFRGKPEQAQQYIAAGFYLSYGTKFNKESLLSTPLERLFIERDEETISLEQHYNNIANILNISAKELAETIERNCKDCGIKFTDE
ncbi:MAG: hypothetical protein E7089_10150 [Bacteroidales bacterium]|nr:hypothetical protein [Bacteroidales bacterium]